MDGDCESGPHSIFQNVDMTNQSGKIRLTNQNRSTTNQKERQYTTMSDTTTPETVIAATADPTGETAEKIEKVERKPRFTGDISLTGENEYGTGLDGMMDAPADLTSNVGRGRPANDLVPYINILVRNYRQNRPLPEKEKVQKQGIWASDAVGTVKSRFGQAAKFITDANLDEDSEYFGQFPGHPDSTGKMVEIGVGLTWFQETIDEDFAAEHNLADNKIGQVMLGFVAGDRLENRGRKPKAETSDTNSNTNPSSNQ
jgi:hypothetical protein